MKQPPPAQPTPSRILAINAGSSSIKFALFEGDDSLERMLTGGIDAIGQPQAILRASGPALEENVSHLVTVPDQGSAVNVLMHWIEQRIGRDGVTAVGHRVVHGGPRYSEPERIDAQMLAVLRDLVPFDPEHLPQEIRLIEAFHHWHPDLLQVACFDTSFHRDLPRVARILPIPRRYEAQGIRRYGFHGLSYAFVMNELARVAGTQAARGRVILAHLGSGASLAAVRGGKSIDTSMGFTPTSGLMMSTRTGDLDPGVAGYLLQQTKLTPAAFDRLVNHESGLLGVSGTSADMRELIALAATDVRAAEAVELFCYQVRKWIGAYAAALGGLDTLVFAAGIGENAPAVRTWICSELAFLGITLDEQNNETNAGVISGPNSPVTIRVMHTDEELMIAQSVCSVLAAC